MGRRSPLTPKQWQDIEKRLINGEAGCALAKEYGVTYNAIKKRFGSQTKQIKAVANQILETERNFKALPISSQISAVNLADLLRSISGHLGHAANYGAMTAHRISGIANAQADKIDDANPIGDEASLATLKGISALTTLANNSAEIGINLLKANKETIDNLNKSDDKPEPKQVVFTVIDASA